MHSLLILVVLVMVFYTTTTDAFTLATPSIVQKTNSRERIYKNGNIHVSNSVLKRTSLQMNFFDDAFRFFSNLNKEVIVVSIIIIIIIIIIMIIIIYIRPLLNTF